MKENKKLSIPTKTEKEPEVVQWKDIGWGFDPKKEIISFHHKQPVKVVDWFYKWYRWIALWRRMTLLGTKQAVLYQVELESMDIVDCFGHELMPLDI